MLLAVMGEWILNNAVVRGHSLFDSCKSTLNEVSLRDYQGRYYFNPAIECLDMDTYEKDVQRRGQPSRTTDAVIGISTYENGNAIDPRLLLVELRMGYCNVSNLSKSDIESKVQNTKSLLAAEKPINRDSVFVFNDKFFSQAKYWFDRIHRESGRLKCYVPFSYTDLVEKIKTFSDFERQQYIHSDSDIREKLEEYRNKCEWEAFLKQMGHWCKVAVECEYRNPGEYQHIILVLKEVWTSAKAIGGFTEEEEFHCLLMEEDYEFLI